VLRKIETPAIFRFVDSILAGRAIELYNFGHLRRDFTFVEDIVEGIVSVLALPPRGGSAQGRGVTGSYASVKHGKPAASRASPRRFTPSSDAYETHACVDKLREVTG
jgi:nucleoside-diphosphate-sugar epimerase